MGLGQRETGADAADRGAEVATADCEVYGLSGEEEEDDEEEEEEGNAFRAFPCNQKLC